MLKKFVQFLATIIVLILVGFYAIISLPTVETFFAPVIVKTTYSTERVEEGTLFSFAGFKIRPCRTISSSWSYDDTEGRSTTLNVKNMRTSSNTYTFNTTLDLGRFSVGPILLENLSENAKTINLVVFHSCHIAWNTMTQLKFDIIKN